MAASPWRPQLVIFDAFGTLVRPAAGFEGTFVDALTARGIDASPQVMARLQSASAGLEHRRWSRTREEYDTWTRQTLLRGGSDLLGEFASHVIPALEQRHQAPMERFADVVGCLEALRSQGVAVAICSNWGWDLADDLAGAGLGGLADFMVSSAEAGCRKPHPDIYDRVLQHVGVKPAETVFVGDSIEPDVHGPQRVGITGILLDRTAAGSPGSMSIGSLAELAEHIGL